MSSIPAIGEFNKVVKWEKVVKVTDSTGGQDEQYMDWFTGRAALKRMSQARKLNMGYDEMVEVYDGWMQWRHAIESDLTKDTRIVFDNRFFKVDNFSLVDEKRRIYKMVLKQVR